MKEAIAHRRDLVQLCFLGSLPQKAAEGVPQFPRADSCSRDRLYRSDLHDVQYLAGSGGEAADPDLCGRIVCNLCCLRLALDQIQMEDEDLQERPDRGSNGHGG